MKRQQILLQKSQGIVNNQSTVKEKRNKYNFIQLLGDICIITSDDDLSHEENIDKEVKQYV